MGPNASVRAAHSPKVHVVDSGLAAYLLGITPDKLVRRDPATLAEFGHLFETFVVGELIKQASWRDDVRELGHWRTHNGRKSISSPKPRRNRCRLRNQGGSRGRPKGLPGLRALREALGDQFRAGFFFNTGTEAYRIEDRIYVARSTGSGLNLARRSRARLRRCLCSSLLCRATDGHSEREYDTSLCG